MSGEITFQTERLRLRRLTLEDAAPLFSYRSLPEVYRFQTFCPVTVSDAAGFIGSTAAEMDLPGTWHQLGIFLTGERRLIGDVGIHFPAGDQGMVELGCTLAPGYQGQGYATEALAAVIGHLFGSLKKSRISYSVDPRNEPSRRLAERLGMRQVGCFKNSCLIRGELCDDVVFELTPEGWARRSRS